MKTNKRKGIPAATFMASFSSAGCAMAPAAAAIDNHPKITVVERWDGTKWVEVKLTWNGTEYKESK